MNLIANMLFYLDISYSEKCDLFWSNGDTFTNGNDGRPKFYVNDKGVYARILIKRVF